MSLIKLNYRITFKPFLDYTLAAFGILILIPLFLLLAYLLYLKNWGADTLYGQSKQIKVQPPRCRFTDGGHGKIYP